jgi:DHA2 family multidrug resistance protein
VLFGLLLGGTSCLMMSRYTLDTSAHDIVLPQLVQGVALACIFIPLQTVALARVDRRRMSAATGVSNLIRQLGGSFGIAIFASLLGRYATRAKVIMSAHVSVTDPAVYGRLAGIKAMLMGKGMDAASASAQALSLTNLQVTAQATMISFERTFFICGLMFFLTVPLVFLLDDGRAKKKAEAGSADATATEGHGEHLAVEL